MSALVIEKLNKSFGGLRVTRNVNLNVERGERRLIIGPNGAGKTTLFNLITGELSPDAGSITLFGRDITRAACRKRAHLGMARTYQIITLFPRDTLLRNVTLSLLGITPLRWNPLVRLDAQTALVARAREVLARVGLGHLAERRDVLALVTGIPRDVTIVMIEHDMDVALDFAERITVLHFGEVVVEGTRGEVVAHPRTREIYLGD